MADVCPVIGTTTNVLPPDHPTLSSDPEARCPVTNAKVSHHNNIIHAHPLSPTIPDDKAEAMDATHCPALQNVNSRDSVTDATCPVVGPVSAMLPPNHPKMNEEDAGKVCPVTNATLEHHKENVQYHPSVPEGSPIQQCPVAGNMLK